MSALAAEVCMEQDDTRLEPRVARIESDVASLKETVIRLDDKVDERFDKVDERFDKVDERFAKIDEKFERLDGKVSGLDVRMAAMEHDFVNLMRNQSAFQVGLRDLRNSLDTKFLWILSTMITFGIALLAAMAKGFHWFK